jgi:hypothetical protein
MLSGKLAVPGGTASLTDPAWMISAPAWQPS